jgi:hypothetical protein
MICGILVTVTKIYITRRIHMSLTRDVLDRKAPDPRGKSIDWLSDRWIDKARADGCEERAYEAYDEGNEDEARNLMAQSKELEDASLNTPMYDRLPRSYDNPDYSGKDKAMDTVDYQSGQIGNDKRDTGKVKDSETYNSNTQRLSTQKPFGRVKGQDADEYELQSRRERGVRDASKSSNAPKTTMDNREVVKVSTEERCYGSSQSKSKNPKWDDGSNGY